MQLHLHHQTNLSLNKFMHSDFWLFELSVWLHVFARSLIIVFIPILLLGHGFSVGEIMVYYLIFNIFDVPMNFFAEWVVRKIGARLTIVAGTLSSIAYFAVLFNLSPGNWTLLIILAFFAALYDVLYWVAHIYYFMESMKKRNKITKDTSTFYIVKKIGNIFAPAFGALILIFFSEHLLIVFSITFLLLSIWPLVKMKTTEDRPTTPSPSFKEFFKKKTDVKDFAILALFGFHGTTEYIIWPLFIYIIFGTVESVAAIPIILAVTTVAATYYAGNIRKKDRSSTLMLGSFLIAVIWILRLFLESYIFYYASIFLMGLFSILVMIPLDSNVYEQARHKDALSISTYRNTFSMASRIVMYGILVLLVNVFNVSFIIAATSMVVITAISFFFMRNTPLLTQTTDQQ